MTAFLIKPASGAKGNIKFSGDKSIAHRAVMLSALSHKKTTVLNFPSNEDCQFTIQAFRKLGIKIVQSKSTLQIYGNGLFGLKKPYKEIFVGESGTTARLLIGLLAAQNFTSRISASPSLLKRPMLRVIYPLRLMDAQISSRALKGKKEEYLPLTIKGTTLKPIIYKMPVASAQVKSAILLAGLYAEGITEIIEKTKSRDHTERMLKMFGANITVKGNLVTLKGGKELNSPGNIFVPGDISSASFFIVLACLLPKSCLCIKNVSLNPTRTGIIKVLKRMGANIKLLTGDRRPATKYEPMGDIIVKTSSLKATIVRKEEIASLIDELPILMVAASLAKGKTILKGVGELRVKETDRINSLIYNLQKMGVNISSKKLGKEEDIVIEGIKKLKGAELRSFNDHRTTMSMIVAALSASGESRIDDVSCISKSFPEFLKVLKSIINK